MFNIRNAGKLDIALIRELTWQVWPQTYASILSNEQIDYMLDMMYSENSLAKQMDDGAQFVIISADSIPVGFASYQQTAPKVYKLHKLYVLPSQQGKGTGRHLIDHVIRTVSHAGGRALQLQVNRNNKAKMFYEKLGFRAISEIKLDIGNGYFMDDYIMELDIPVQ